MNIGAEGRGTVHTIWSCEKRIMNSILCVPKQRNCAAKVKLVVMFVSSKRKGVYLKLVILILFVINVHSPKMWCSLASEKMKHVGSTHPSSEHPDYLQNGWRGMYSSILEYVLPVHSPAACRKQNGCRLSASWPSK